MPPGAVKTKQNKKTPCMLQGASQNTIHSGLVPLVINVTKIFIYLTQSTQPGCEVGITAPLGAHFIISFTAKVIYSLVNEILKLFKSLF